MVLKTKHVLKKGNIGIKTSAKQTNLKKDFLYWYAFFNCNQQYMFLHDFSSSVQSLFQCHLWIVPTVIVLAIKTLKLIEGRVKGVWLGYLHVNETQHTPVKWASPVNHVTVGLHHHATHVEVCNFEALCCIQLRDFFYSSPIKLFGCFHPWCFK